MPSAVAKHSYVRAGGSGSGRAGAHIDYIGQRPGEDRNEEGIRPFFDDERNDLTLEEVHDLVDENQPTRGVIMHKMILSPGDQGVDTREYARDTMRRLRSEMGLDLRWAGVVHNNTEHTHAHIVILGKDENGRNVIFDQNIYARMREIGNEYVGRELNLDRYLDREWERINDRDRDLPREDRFGVLMYGLDGLLGITPVKERDREREDDPERDWNEHEKLERDFKGDAEEKKIDPERFGSVGFGADSDFGKGYPQILREQQGALGDFHELFTANQAQERAEIDALHNPDFAEEIREHAEHLDEMFRDGPSFAPSQNFEDIFGFDTKEGADDIEFPEEEEDASLGDIEHSEDDLDRGDPEIDFGALEGPENAPDDIDIALPNESELAGEMSQESAIGISEATDSGSEGRDDSDNLFAQGGF